VSLSQCCSCVSCVPGAVTGLLLPHLAGVVIVGAAEDGGRVRLAVRPAVEEGACPRCGAVSGRVHSRYQRRLRDVPAGGRDVVIWLAAIRFRCLDPGCPAVTFAGQVEGLASRYARRTPLLAAHLAAVAAALCGRAGSRLAAALGTAAPSRQTMIRLLMAVPLPEPAAAPRALGVDDFALRRGHVYGTVLIDMATGQVVDLLPDREAATLEGWLRAHPGAAVICRDRAGAYADGARQGAPGAVQVADRWHLWHNLCERAAETAAAHRSSCLAAAPAGRDQPEHHDQPEHQEPPAPDPDPDPDPGPGLAGRTRRRHAEVHQLLAAGHSRAAIARALGLSRPTVRRYADAGGPGEVTPAARESALDPYKPYLIQQWNAGARDAAILHAQVRALGYAGSDQPVRRFVRPFRDLPAAPPAPTPIPSARKIASWLATRPADLAEDDAAALAAALAACPHLEELHRHIRGFARMMTTLTGYKDLDNWLDAADASTLPPLKSFAAGIRRDHDAVLSGLTLTWNSGKVEGTVNKIKMLKRQTYGRAGFALLRHRVLLN
jgi:transposase